MSEMTPSDVPRDLVLAAAWALADFPDTDDGDGTAEVAVMLAAVLPLHEQQVRAAVAVELEKQAHAAAVRDVNGPFCVEAATWTRAAQTVRGGLDA